MIPSHSRVEIFHEFLLGDQDKRRKNLLESQKKRREDFVNIARWTIVDSVFWFKSFCTRKVFFLFRDLVTGNLSEDDDEDENEEMDTTNSSGHNLDVSVEENMEVVKLTWVKDFLELTQGSSHILKSVQVTPGGADETKQKKRSRYCRMRRSYRWVVTGFRTNSNRPGHKFFINYRNQLMQSEWFVDVPEDFPDQWTWVAAPAARRSRVTRFCENSTRLLIFLVELF